MNRKLVSLAITLVLVLSNVGCSERFVEKHINTTIKDPIDRDINMSRDEFKEVLRPLKQDESQKQKEEQSQKELPYSPVVLAPEPPDVLSAKTATLSITEDVPIKDVLIELARLADLELALDPNISGGIILKVKERPIKDIVEMIADQASLRYSIENGILKVQKDGPYLASYNVDYINMNRSSKGTISTQTQVLSVDTAATNGGAGGGGGDGKGLTSGSNSEITISYDGDIWKTIEENLSKIVYGFDQGLIKDDNSSSQKVSAYYTINKQASTITVMADSKKQKAIKKYLDKLKQSLSAQVLIEAKIIEVSLSELYSAGIDWERLSGKDFVGTFGFAPSFSTSNDTVFGTIATSQIQKSNERSGALSSVAKFLEGFGTTRVLQNPRVTALNNQQAVLTFAKNKPYFTVQGTAQQEVTNTGGNTTTQPVTVTSTLRTIPIGIILSLQPSINLETQEVIMNIRPTLSKEASDQAVQDPAAQILNSSIGGNTEKIKSEIPVVEVREMDTVLKVKSGDIMVIGGLIEHEDNNRDTGVPGVSRIPLLGNLAKQVEKKTYIRETVILIQATIIPSGYYHPQDKKVYQTMMQDSRPLTF
jgi:general secretion pathway protein D